MKNYSDFDLLVACLHHSGELSGKLSAREQETVRLAGNGFPMVNELGSGFSDLIWEWSHVRDSSEKAIGRMAEICRIFLSRKDC